jgi:hypothetical protein
MGVIDTAKHLKPRAYDIANWIFESWLANCRIKRRKQNKHDFVDLANEIYYPEGCQLLTLVTMAIERSSEIKQPRSAMVALLETLIKDHFEWCKGTPENKELVGEEQDMLAALHSIAGDKYVQIIYEDDPIELKLWDERTIEIGSKVVQIRQGGNVIAVYERQQAKPASPRHEGFWHRAARLLFPARPEYPGNCQVCGAGTKISIEVTNVQGIAPGWYCFEHLLAAWKAMPVQEPGEPLEIPSTSTIMKRQVFIGQYFCELCDETNVPKLYKFRFGKSGQSTMLLCQKCAAARLIARKSTIADISEIYVIVQVDRIIEPGDPDHDPKIAKAIREASEFDAQAMDDAKRLKRPDLNGYDDTNLRVTRG